MHQPTASSTTFSDQTRKIAIISDAEPCRNGVGAYYSDLTEHLHSRGFSVRLFCPVGENGRSSAAITLPLPGDSSQRLCLPKPFELNAQLLAFKPDIAILPTPGVYGLTGAFLCERLQLPVLVGFHTAFEQLAELYWQHSVMSKVVQQYFRNSHAYLFSRCDRVVANSRDMCRLAQRLGAEDAELIGTLLPRDFIDQPVVPHSGAIRRVLFAGRLAAEKNLETVVAAARQSPQISFSIAGDGPLRPQVLEWVNEIPNLDYLGWLTRDALRAQLDKHDLLILPSHFESFGNIALEAMARQRPVVVSSRCGIAKWRDLQIGMRVIQDGDALSAAIADLSSNAPEALREMAVAARKAAIRLNDSSLDHWCQLLLGTQKIHALRAIA